MKIEKSCGAVVFFRNRTTLEYLVIKMKQGHYSFPKGHVEPQETELDTALRGIKEETGLDCVIDGNFRETVTYSPVPGVVKDVVFFVAETFHKDLTIQKEELDYAGFFEEEQAEELVTYASDRAVFEQAVKYIKKKIRGERE